MGIVGLLVVLAGAYHPVFLAAVLGYLGHVVGDHLANKPLHPLSYSIVFRAFHGFDHTRLFAPSEGTFYESMAKTIPLWRFIEPVFAKAEARIRKSPLSRG